jgi:peptide/nickel transport system permease protein
MWRMAGARLLQAVPLLFIVTFVTFFLQLFIPGNAAQSIGGLSAPPAEIAALRQRLHLNDPVWVQYWDWLKLAIHGNLGSSIISGQSVAAQLNTRLGVTLSLVLSATLLALIIGLALGTVSARGGRVPAAIANTASLAGISIPAFWLGLIGIWVFSTKLSWLPANGYTFFSASPKGWALSLVLPVCALAFFGVTVVAKVAREQLVDIMNREFIRNLRSNGVSESRILLRHALRHALIPVLTVSANNLIGLLGAAVVIEELFGLPGLGSLAVTATSSGDIPVIQGVAVYFTLIVISINLVLDVLVGWINPQVAA